MQYNDVSSLVTAGRRDEPDTAVQVFVIVPADEPRDPLSCHRKISKCSLGIRWPVLQRLEVLSMVAPFIGPPLSEWSVS
jgi:hypothetical protein